MRNFFQSSFGQVPVACQLQDAKQMQERLEEMKEIYKLAQQRQELADGYAFSFASEDVLITRLVEWIKFERRCCQFFSFELVFEPQEGPLWLCLRGPEGAKEWLQGYLAVE
ncbi:hypothetical protein EPA93_28010 [Ktedonosporobacter rubrisoli]|uniref:Uncharacterized protein n=1 Tax=Ktedonosporobacter rubrisoli TaxID=2509675 RepID=A0A4P6JVY4_KTERU|nr:hypothetical protein [Ktedonosporobacter rubrisoli]QBD79615.1 hypothetical protein EPA93_28010 [Ktedonosporobacter rubrisoli]